MKKAQSKMFDSHKQKNCKFIKYKSELSSELINHLIKAIYFITDNKKRKYFW